MVSEQQMGATSRREVTVNGRRVTVIDMHAHTSVPEAQALLGRVAGRVDAAQALPLGSAAMRLAAMDTQGIDVEALSINPYWYRAERDAVEPVIALQNEKLAEFCAAHPDRFVGLGSVALQYPDLAAQQLEKAMQQQGLRGTLIGGSVNGEELADRKFGPFWAKAEQLGAVVFIHPQGTAALESRLQGNGLLTNTIGNPLETTIALSHLIFEGTLDRYPQLQVLAAHGGGYLPSYAARSDAVMWTFPNRCTPLPKKPTEYLKQIYVDSMVFTPEGLRHLAAEMGSDHIVLGTDFPYPWTDRAVDHVMETPGFSDEERIAILGGTAARLLRLGN